MNLNIVEYNTGGTFKEIVKKNYLTKINILNFEEDKDFINHLKLNKINVINKIDNEFLKNIEIHLFNAIINKDNIDKILMFLKENKPLIFILEDRDGLFDKKISEDYEENRNILKNKYIIKFKKFKLNRYSSPINKNVRVLIGFREESDFIKHRNLVKRNFEIKINEINFKIEKDLIKVEDLNEINDKDIILDYNSYCSINNFDNKRYILKSENAYYKIKNSGLARFLNITANKVNNKFLLNKLQDCKLFYNIFHSLEPILDYYIREDDEDDVYDTYDEYDEYD